LTCGKAAVGGNYNSTRDKKRAGKHTYQSVEVGAGTWIGAGSTILPGVHIGEGCVIAAGSVVTRDIPANTMYGGVPAKYIKNMT
ncbi:MAG: acyltransferase, partial [Lachnospiraceae bacterium]